MDRIIGKSGKLYANFSAQLSDDAGYQEMVDQHAAVGGRKAAEIEYELHRYVIAILGDNEQGNKYADYAVRELKFGAEWIRVFVDVLGRAPAAQ